MLDQLDLDIAAFTRRLHGMGAAEIGSVAATLRSGLETPDGEVLWWRATIELTDAIRRHRCTRQASVAAHRASSAVLAAARNAGIGGDEHRSDVTAVARAAGEAARLRVLLACTSLVAATAQTLLDPWDTVVPAA